MTTADEPMSIIDVPRNDVAAAVAFYVSNGKRITRDDWSMLRLLQDNPRNFERVSRNWIVIQN